MMFFVVGLTIVVLLCYMINQQHRKICKEFPPGPPSIPFFGSFPFLDLKNGNSDAVLDKAFYRYDKYMYTVWLGRIPLIVIQDFNLAKELFAREEFCGRPATFHDKYIRGEDGYCLGIVTTMDSYWQDQRRFTLKHLKDLGFGRKKLETIIHEEIKCLIDDLIINSRNSKDVLISSTFNFPIINILWQIVASKKYDPELPESKEMMSKVSRLFELGIPVLDFLVSSMRHRLPLLSVDKLTLDLKSLFREQIQEHDNEYKSGDIHEPSNFIDIYLREIEEQKRSIGVNEERSYSSFNTDQLTIICLDLFQAGSETSSTTLSWAVMYLTLYQDVQEKCWMEINQQLGGK